jgi:tRNA G18 (ribose-2'-O)-methylase SpoU
MVRIDSPDDARLDRFRHAADPAELARRGLIVVEGRGPVEHLLADSAMTVEALLLTEAARLALSATLERAGAAERWPGGLDRLRAEGLLLVALTPRPDALAIEAAAAAQVPGTPVAIMVGAEGPGLAVAAMARADVRARIVIDPAADSLNVAVAAGIALNAFR